MKRIKILINKFFGFFGYTLTKKVYSSTRGSKIELFSKNSSDRELSQFCMYQHVIHKTRNVPGDIVEFGVSSGTSLVSFIRLNSIYNKNVPNDIGRKSVFGFDTFEGLPFIDSQTDLNSKSKLRPSDMKIGGYDGSQSYNELNSFCKKYKNVKLYKGLFSDTVPRFKKENKHHSFSLIHIDCDLYESTKDALEGLILRLNVGGIILFDEIFHEYFPGETSAFFDVYNNLIGSDYNFTLKFKRVNSMPWKWYAVRIS